MSTFQSIGLLLSKLSILIFFKRVFTTRKRPFHIALVVVGAYSILVCVATFIEFTVQCLPVPFFWDRAYAISGIAPPHPISGWCMPQHVHASIPAIANLISDLSILGLPAIGLWGLQMPKTKKIGIFFALSVGLFVCITEVVRIYYIFKTENAGDTTWANAGVLLWTAVECCVSVVCACIPTMAPLLKHARGKNGSKSQYPWDIGRSVRSLGAKIFVGLPRFIRLTDTESIKDAHQKPTRPRGPEAFAVASSKRAASEEQDIPLEGIQVSHAVDITRNSC